MRDFTKLRGVNPRQLSAARLAQYCTAADLSEEALREELDAVRDCVGAFLAWQLLPAGPAGIAGTVSEYVYAGLPKPPRGVSPLPAHEKAEGVLREAVRSIVRKTVRALFPLGITAGKKKAEDLAERLWEDLPYPMSAPLEAVMPPAFWHLTLTELRDRYDREARRVQEERERYRRDLEEARARREEQLKAKEAALVYEGEAGRFFSREDEEGLAWLTGHYSAEEIGLLCQSGKIRLSESLRKKYTADRTPKPDKSRYRTEFLPDYTPAADRSRAREMTAAYEAAIREDREESAAPAKPSKKKEKQSRKKERQAAIRTAIVNTIPDNYIDLFPLARAMRRHFVLHIGPTNSGKTHDAIRALMEAENGIYLGPLRLLAFEQYETLNENGFPCSLVTGEERLEVPGARYQASTVEMLNTKTVYETAVIDEAQMIGDPDRGGAWTRAVLGICAREIHVCVAPIAQALLIRLIRDCGDSYETVRHQRMTPLTVEHGDFSLERSTREGDALIVFSRKSVHGAASYLQKRGIKCSVIYGALPYDVRREQARLFAEGMTGVVVATDAIGMGMNLPIRRVVFLEQEKFDGTTVRSLTAEEYKQIAGRAGRYGIYPEGLVSSAENRSRVKTALESKSATVKSAVIAFPESLLGIDAKLSEIIERWGQIETKPGYERADPARMLKLCRLIEPLSEDKRFLYDCISMTFDEEDAELLTVWQIMCEKEAIGEVFEVEEDLPSEEVIGGTENLGELEAAFRRCDLLYGYCEKFLHTQFRSVIMRRKNLISARMTAILARQALREKKCAVCGKELPWSLPYSLCDRCFRRRKEERLARREMHRRT
ncbi:MAG: hypothetical protein ILP12_06770 [Lachnospiraceae bacterium]|nr:hypothetical protein [Lachnospiraceae bacterium]